MKCAFCDTVPESGCYYNVAEISESQATMTNLCQRCWQHIVPRDCRQRIMRNASVYIRSERKRYDPALLPFVPRDEPPELSD